LCSAVEQLEKDTSERIKNACNFDPAIHNKEKQKIAELVGKRCLINGAIGDVTTECLWDTGSQVALISSAWIHANLDKAPLIRPIADLLEIEAVGVPPYHTMDSSTWTFQWARIQ
jgi:hypothetical protein